MHNAQDNRQRIAIRIFLVEDSPAVRELIVENCVSVPDVVWLGFADSETDALSQLDAISCDVLIVDIELRQGNGISLLRKLSERQSHTGDLKIIFSNNVCDAYRRAGAQYGVQHVLDKSFDLPQLHSLLAQRRSAMA